jgi:hypothetical protein
MADAYGMAGAITEQKRLLYELGVRTAQDTTIADRQNLVRTIAQKLDTLDDIDALQRLMPQDPTAPWAQDVAIRAGNKGVLLELLSSPDVSRVPAVQALERYFKGVTAREGAIGLKREVVALGHFVADKTAGKQTPAAKELAESWDQAATHWLPALLREADRPADLTGTLDWAQRTARLNPESLDGALESFIGKREEAGDEQAFETLSGRLRSDKIRLEIIDWAIKQRVDHGRIESALALSRPILDSPRAMDETMNAVSYSSVSSCTGPRKPRLALDRSYALVKSGFVDCGSMGQTAMLMVVGESLAKGRQYEPARKVLDYVQTADRRPTTKPCPASYRSRELAAAYFVIGAIALVREYAQLIADICIVDVSNAYFVGRMLTLLDSPDTVPDLLKARKFQTEDARQSLVLGWIAGLVEKGLADPLPAALGMVDDKRAAVAEVHAWLRDTSGVDGRRKAAAILRAALPLLHDQYLVFDEKQFFSVPQAPQWMVAYAEVGLGPQVADLIREMADRSVAAINADAEKRGDKVRSTDSQSDILALATLFLASRLIDPKLDVQRWASRLDHKLMRAMFLAVSCEALALTGDRDGAVRVAAQLDSFGPRPEIGDYYSPSVFAWPPLISLRARDGDLAGSYRFALDHKRGVYIPTLIRDYKEGLAARAH